MIPAQKVSETLYNFSMYAFHDFACKEKEVPLRKNAQERILALLDSADFLTAEEATMLPRKQKKVLYGMLTWYISFFSLPEWPPFQDDILIGSSERQLSAPILRYMHQHSGQIVDLL